MCKALGHHTGRPTGLPLETVRKDQLVHGWASCHTEPRPPLLHGVAKADKPTDVFFKTFKASSSSSFFKITISNKDHFTSCFSLLSVLKELVLLLSRNSHIKIVRVNSVPWDAQYVCLLCNDESWVTDLCRHLSVLSCNCLKCTQ